MEITNRDDLRVGDTATFAYSGHEITGPLWERESDRGSLVLGSACLRYQYRPTGEIRWSKYFTFVRATRPAPVLPTAVGSVIEISVVGDTHLFVPILAMLTAVDEWTLPRQIEGRWAVAPYRITEWRPMKVVPA